MPSRVLDTRSRTHAQAAAAAEEAAARARRQFLGITLPWWSTQDVVTAGEITVRAPSALVTNSRRRGESPPDLDALRKELAQEALIEDRVLVTLRARIRRPIVDEGELDRVVANVAAQNRLNLDQLQDRLLQG
jgi:peptidyl-prolyl cis-trans isomerase SurA